MTARKRKGRLQIWFGQEEEPRIDRVLSWEKALELKTKSMNWKGTTEAFLTPITNHRGASR